MDNKPKWYSSSITPDDSGTDGYLLGCVDALHFVKRLLEEVNYQPDNYFMAEFYSTVHTLEKEAAENG